MNSIPAELGKLGEVHPSDYRYEDNPPTVRPDWFLLAAACWLLLGTAALAWGFMG